MWILAEGQHLKITLQSAAPADVERGAVEGAAKCGVVQELTGIGSNPHFSIARIVPV